MAKSAAVKVNTKPSYLARKKSAPSSFQFADLNDNCLIHIFECLDVISLAKMCRVGTRYHDIITSHVIPLRLVDFRTFSDQFSVRKMFALFGKSMTRISICEDDIQIIHPECMAGFAEFLRLLVEYGEPGKLKELSMSFVGLFTVPASILASIGPFFANVNKLHIDFDHCFDPDFTKFMKVINARNVRELRMCNVVLLDEWLSVEALPNIQRLHFCFISNLSVLEHMMNELILMQFFSTKPASLTNFDCVQILSDRVFAELALHIPGIKHLGQLRLWPNDDDDDDNNNNDIGGEAMVRRAGGKWKYLNAFTNLNQISLKSTTADFSDMSEVFSVLAKQQTIEELWLSLGMDSGDQDHPVRIGDVKRFTQLKTLHLYNFNDNRSKDFINLLFTHLSALTSCTIIGKHPNHKRIIELIKLARNLKALTFVCKFTTFSLPFYKKLLKCRASPDDHNLNPADQDNQLVIHVDVKAAQKCLNDLGPKRYKPSVILIRSLPDHLQLALDSISQ